MVLELTLKHVKALTNLIDQQQQKILALQSGLQAGECPCLARISGGAGAREGGGSSTDGEPAGQHLLLGTFLPRTARARSRWGRCRVSVLRGRAFRVGTLLCHLAGRPGGQMVTGSWAFWLRSFWVPGVSPFLVKCEGPWNSHVGVHSHSLEEAARACPRVFLGLCFLVARCVAWPWQGDSRSFSCISCGSLNSH